jgi:hypothetical protein
MSPLFPNIQSTLDLNGPELSILQATTRELGESSFSITPSLPDGSTKIDLISLDDFAAFDSSIIYTLTANGDFDLTIDLEGAVGGTPGGNSGTGGKGGKVTGTVSFESGEVYKLVIGSKGAPNGGAGAVGGGGASSGVGGGSGGGFTGIFKTSISQENALLIAGGGGGSSSQDDPDDGPNSSRKADGGDGGGLTGGYIRPVDGNTSFSISGQGGTQIAGGSGGSTNFSEYYGSDGAALLGGAGNTTNSTGGGGGGYFGGGGGGYVASTINGSGGGGSGFVASTNVINGYFSNASNADAGKVNFIRSTFSDRTLILSGIATAKFPDIQTERNTNTGDIAYRWYEDGVGPLSDSANIVGSATTTVNISGLSFNDNGRKFFLRADYTPSAYGSIGAAKSTPNALNDPLDFSTFTLGVAPSIVIVTQPENSTVVQNLDTIFSVTASIQDGSNDSLSFDWQYNGQSLSGIFSNLVKSQEQTNVVGGRQSALTIKNSTIELAKISCIISSVNASSPVSSNIANLDVSASRIFIKWEKFGNAIRTEEDNRNLAKTGPFTARALTANLHRTIQMWSPEKDIVVKITMGGAAGRTTGGGRGGEGGISVFKMTMKQNTEYTVKLGVNSFQGGGPRGGNNGGGGLAAIYEMAKVLAVCGGGGGAGSNGRGGDGGGLGIPGETVYFNGSGNGGVLIDVDALPSTGMTQAGRTGLRDFNNEDRGSGRLSGCTIGNYWNDQGKLPCQPLGNNVEFLTSQGATYSPTTGIERGYKVGQGHRNNGGAGSGNQGGGGAGARGGEGASGNGAGGGGASGYYSSQVEILSSSSDYAIEEGLKKGTKLGGNADVAFISVEVYDESLDGIQDPLIPPDSEQSQTERTVTWKVVRSAAFRSEVIFIRQSGVGPYRITWGPNGGDVTSQILAGAVYVKEETKIEGTSGGHLKVNSDGSLGFDDYSGRDRPDHGYEDLTIYPSIGTFSSSSSRPEHQGDTWRADWS